jgi:CheY-like chemotaxis protein
MSDDYIQDFDLIALLKLGCLDIRSIVSTKPEMTVEEYFGLLSKFINLLPAATGALTKFVTLEGDENAVKYFVDISVLMAGIGCEKFLPDMDSIIVAFKKGDTKLSSECAKKISDDFVDLYTRIKNAQTSIENPTINKSSSLKDILKQLDDDEATRKLRILAIDDSAVILKTVSSVLSDRYKVFTLADPTKLKKFLNQITPELFLLDYKMPEISGFDLIPIIRSFKEHKDTPVIFLTSEGTLENLSAAVMLGACDFVVKPVTPEILREKIGAHISRKKQF